MADSTLPRRHLPDWARAALLLAALALLWRLASLLLMLFLAIVLAVAFRMLAHQLARRLPMPDRAALAVVALTVLALLGGALYLFGDTVRNQVGELLQSLPQAWQTLRQRVDQWSFAPQLRDWLGGNAPDAGALATQLGVAATSIAGVATNAVLVLVGAIYFAAQPGLYRRGVIALVPTAHRVRAGRLLDRIADALEDWLKGQLVAMVLVGLLIGIGLALIGLPSAIALGLLAALAEFVPIIGPILAAIPALLLAATLGWTALLWTLALFVLVQQIEGHLLMPAIMQQALALPPAVTLFSVLAFGLLFGLLGVLLATPLAVVLMVLVQQLYLQQD